MYQILTQPKVEDKWMGNVQISIPGVCLISFCNRLTEHNHGLWLAGHGGTLLPGLLIPNIEIATESNPCVYKWKTLNGEI